MQNTDEILYNNDIFNINLHKIPRVGFKSILTKKGEDMVTDYAKYREDNGRTTNGFSFYQYNLYAIPGLNVSPHWHDEFEILFPKTDGFMILDGEKITFEADDILFINPRQLHSTYHTNAGWSYHFVIHPDLLSLGNILNEKNKRFHFPEKINAGETPCRMILEEIMQLPTPISDTNKLFIMSKLFEILFYLLENGYSSVENEPNMTVQAGYIKSALEYIHQHIKHKISVQSIADEVGISKEHLMRLFKTYTGETVNSYIQIHRLEKACQDLVAGYSLTDIVYKYDYSDVSYFCRLFKNRFGVSPGKYMSRYASQKQTIPDTDKGDAAYEK